MKICFEDEEDFVRLINPRFFLLGSNVKFKLFLDFQFYIFRIFEIIKFLIILTHTLNANKFDTECFIYFWS